MSSEAGYAGMPRPWEASSGFNAQTFMVMSLLSKICTATIVQVKAVTSAGEAAEAGFVDILPLVNLLDADNNAQEHGTIYRCPYLRVQGGANAIIMDPQVGDLGIAIFADRDISSVVTNKGQANPGSRRRFDWADAMYIGGLLNGTPSQYVQFNAAGITVMSPGKVTVQAGSEVDVIATTKVSITAPTIQHNGATVLNGPISQVPGTQTGGASTFDGPLTVTNDVTAAGKSVSTHTHGGVQTGGGNTGGPN